MFMNIGIPNCVPEYYRSQFEDEAHEAEKEMERHEWYKKNEEYRKQKEKDGFVVIQFAPDECDHCEYKEDAMPTDEWDDIPTIICNNCKWKDCPVLRKDVKEKQPDTDEDEVLSWFDGKENLI